MSNKLHIDDRLNEIKKDLLYTFKWEIQIPGIANVTSTFKKPEDFLIRCRNAEIPGRGVEPIESYFMGMKQIFAGRVNFTHTITIVLEEFQDQGVINALNEWNENVMSVKKGSLFAGGSQKMAKRGGYATDILLIMKGTDNNELKTKYRLYNCFPQNVDNLSLDYTSNDSAKISVTFAYDWWELESA
jgi:hypothetical protein